jgi:hypothetical protein
MKAGSPVDSFNEAANSVAYLSKSAWNTSGKSR